MDFNRLVLRVHAIQRMFQRKISYEDVLSVLRTGEVIEVYPADVPYPSRLILGWCGARPLHAVVADNAETKETIAERIKGFVFAHAIPTDLQVPSEYEQYIFAHEEVRSGLRRTPGRP
ncbi:MAG TPA: DUF4258 domain-containing protein [Proteobacteria bacterium]|nr:DUF4258 domain-containing protein [Pseudomonadota bacterium]